ncbi:MAG: septum formation initiator family protein [Oscillospiraceae bacterium]|jgi:cell division protein FtsB|nr:septum formation initiator family protein [Oscillospiraceae bacterium]
MREKDAGAKAPRKPLITPRLWVALFCVAIAVIAGSLFRVTRLYQTTMAQADKLRAELTTEQIEKDRLTRERDYMATDMYVERAARMEYGYIYPNDIRFVAALEQDEDYGEDWEDPEFGRAVEVFADVE